ncbi:tissue factor pathway inhibitor isoform X2 [Tamandua tetradactyla]|uniref:tissue factor pathway inhibitor isoform X2 n=1 Tax=Tamandua tetradactyla TaxID=48850 RepID=UPI0040538A21
MKKKHIFWVSVCLLLIGAPALLNAVSDDGEEEHSNISGTGNRTQVSSMAVIELPPLKLKNPFCALKADDGPCRALMKRFFFNIQTQQCEEFIYGGCEGNQNRFDSLEECKEKCVTDTELPTLKLKNTFCAMKADDGPCRALMKRFFFNIQTQQCEEFIYGGCGGNQNRFVSLEECKEKCLTDTELPTLKLKNTFCAMKADDGPCRALMKRFFFNIQTQQCEEFIYGGCGGNQNRFVSLEECKEKCLTDYLKTAKMTPHKGRPEFCFLQEDVGLCRGYITRYFYNNESKQCERFKYGGCLGNLNNFESLEECKSTCEDSLTEFQVDDNRTQLVDVNNSSLTPQPTQVSQFWASLGLHHLCDILKKKISG